MIGTVEECLPEAYTSSLEAHSTVKDYICARDIHDDPAHYSIFSELQTEESENYLILKKKMYDIPANFPVLCVNDTTSQMYEKFVSKHDDDHPKADFGISFCFHPIFVLKLLYNGFLTVADGVLEEPCVRLEEKIPDLFGIYKYSEIHPIHYKFTVQVLLPKLHVRRSLIYTNTFTCHRSERKKCRKNYFCTVNNVFCTTLLNCVSLNGPLWVIPKIRDAFIESYYGQCDTIRFHCIELWKKVEPGTPEPAFETMVEFTQFPPHMLRREIDFLKYMFREKQLMYVSGDIAYAVGDMYVAMTGWRSHVVPGAGTVQIIASVYLLKELGYCVMDMGSVMDYKIRIGATLVSRNEFITHFREG
uniref:Ubiquitin-like protein ATG12 n=2 Tax=Lygus hesperus TaxID=30085 RepID=A0A0A9VW35_LYGHE